MHDDVKATLIATMREQATEAYGLRNEPAYSRYECERNANMFNDAADWIDDNWDDMFPLGAVTGHPYRPWNPWTEQNQNRCGSCGLDRKRHTNIPTEEQTA